MNGIGSWFAKSSSKLIWQKTFAKSTFYGQNLSMDSLPDGHVREIQGIEETSHLVYNVTNDVTHNHF